MRPLAMLASLAADREVSELRQYPIFTNCNILTTSVGLIWQWSAKTSGRPQ